MSQMVEFTKGKTQFTWCGCVGSTNGSRGAALGPWLGRLNGNREEPVIREYVRKQEDEDTRLDQSGPSQRPAVIGHRPVAP